MTRQGAQFVLDKVVDLTVLCLRPANRACPVVGETQVEGLAPCSRRVVPRQDCETAQVEAIIIGAAAWYTPYQRGLCINADLDPFVAELCDVGRGDILSFRSAATGLNERDDD